MKKPLLKEAFPIFFLLGVGLVVESLAAAYIQYRWDWRMWAGIGVGLGALILAFFLTPQGPFQKREPFSIRKSLFRAVVIMCLAIDIVGINALVISFGGHLDLTRARQHTLSQTTKEILGHLKQNVRLNVFYNGIVPNYLEDLLKEFQKSAPKNLAYKIADPLVDIGYAAQFGNIIKTDENKVIIESDEQREDITFPPKDILTEEMLLNGILKATRPERIIYFTTGHSEFDTDDDSGIGLSKLKELLEQNNATVKEFTLTPGKKVPADSDVLVIAGPKAPLSNAHQKIIQDYLEAGGKALILIESMPLGNTEHPLSDEDKSRNPALNEILNRWGIMIGNDVVVDTESHVGGDVGCPATKNYPPHKEIVHNLDYTFYIRPRSVTIENSLAPDVKIAPLVRTHSTQNSWAETDETLRVRYDKDIEIPGPVNIGAVIWYPKHEKKQDDTKIIVLTDADFLTNSFIDQFSNAQLALNSIFWLSNLDNVPLNKIPDITIERLNLTSRQTRVIAVMLFCIPIAIICWGILVWWGRSRRP